MMGDQGENFLQTEQLSQSTLQFHLTVSGLSFVDAEKNAHFLHESVGGAPIRCLSALDLLKSKEAANRPVDQQDILYLKAKLGL